MSEPSNDFLSHMKEGLTRSPADVVSADEHKPMADSDFDDALWLSLLGRVTSPEDLSALSHGVRMYFGTRLVEWEVGNGGFSQAIDNAKEYFDEAISGYELLGQPESVELLREAIAKDHDDAALDDLTERVDQPPWNGVPWSDDARIAYVRAHRDQFRI